jgi:hypothetical protein
MSVGSRFAAWLTVAIAVVLATPSAAQPLPRSVLILDQYAGSLPWVGLRNTVFRMALNAGRAASISIYEEFLDFNRFASPGYKESLRAHLGEKYRDKPIGLIVAFGPLALDYAAHIRDALWPGTSIVFGEIAESAMSRSSLPARVTGTTINITLAELVVAARAVDLIDLTGLAMADLRRQVTTLPDHTAIIYTTINLDRAGVSFVPAEALSLVAEVANRPVVISTETFLGRGAVGGFVVTPGTVGRDAARLAARVLDGEDASTIPGHRKQRQPADIRLASAAALGRQRVAAACGERDSLSRGNVVAAVSRAYFGDLGRGSGAGRVDRLAAL